MLSCAAAELGGNGLDYDCDGWTDGHRESAPTLSKDDEKPQHAVDVPAFEIARTELTVADCGSCVASGACASMVAGSCDGGDAPTDGARAMSRLDWLDAGDACAGNGPGWRLCSESEWERAARGGCARPKPVRRSRWRHRRPVRRRGHAAAGEPVP